MQKSENSTWLSYAFILLSFIGLVALLRLDIQQALFSEQALFYDVPESIPTPSLVADIIESSPGYRAIRLKSDNFVLAEACILPEAGESLVGHAHLYADGKKVASLYEAVTLLPQDVAADAKLIVSLHLLPDHRAIRVDGVPVMADVRSDSLH